MKIEVVKYEEKFSKSQYEPVLIGFQAMLTENDNVIDVLSNFKTLAHNFFHTQVMGRQPEPQAAEEEVKPVETAKVESPKAEETKKAAPSRRGKKTEVKEEVKHEVQDGQEVPPVIPTEAQEEMEEVESPFQAPKDAVMYDLKVKDHRDRFAAYLNKAFPNWKTALPKEKLLAMSQELSGKAFEDSKGVMLESFKNIVSGYFE